MQLTQFPKTQKLFKKYVDLSIEQLIQQSEDLADRYIKERDQILNKKSSSMKSKTEVRKMIVFLERLLTVPEELRQEVEEYRGMKDEEIRQRKQQYQELLQLYESQQEVESGQQPKKLQSDIKIDQQHQTSFRTSPSELILSEDEILSNPKPKFLTKRKCLSMSLKVLQVATVVLTCICVIYRIFFKE